jgi:hypothetical protein
MFASQGAPLVSTTPVANSRNNIDYLHLTVNLKEKIYLFVNSTTQRRLKKIFEIYLHEDFFPVSTSVNDTAGAP